jgi:hypothetical protein
MDREASRIPISRELFLARPKGDPLGFAGILQHIATRIEAVDRGRIPNHPLISFTLARQGVKYPGVNEARIKAIDVKHAPQENTMGIQSRLFVAALLLCFYSPSAHAAWSTFTALNASITATSDPSCASAGAGKVACAVVDQNGKLAVSTYAGSNWSTWTELTNIVTGNPSCTDRAAGEVICAVRSSAGRLMYTIYNGTTWTALAAGPAGVLTDGPSCARLSATRIVCGVRNVAGTFAAALFTTKWTAYKAEGAATTSAPSCASDSAGGAICASRSTTGTVVADRFSSNLWGGQIDLGGTSSGTPTCAKYGVSQQVVCTYNYYSYYTYSNRFLGGLWQLGSWAGWTGAGGNIVNNVSCALVIAGEIACGANSQSNSSFYPNIYTGTWTGYVTQVGGANIGSPACASLGSSQVACVVIGTNNRLSSTIGP